MMGNDQYCLKWNNHWANLIRNFSQLLATETFVDVTLSCEGKEIKAHKLVLGASSPYFKHLLESHPDPHPFVIVKDVSFKELHTIIQYVYNGRARVDKEQLPSLLHTAKELMIKGLGDAQPGNTTEVPGLTITQRTKKNRNKLLLNNIDHNNTNSSSVTSSISVNSNNDTNSVSDSQLDNSNSLNDKKRTSTNSSNINVNHSSEHNNKGNHETDENDSFTNKNCVTNSHSRESSPKGKRRKLEFDQDGASSEKSDPETSGGSRPASMPGPSSSQEVSYILNTSIATY